MRSKHGWAKTCLIHDRDYWQRQFYADQQRQIDNAQARGVPIDDRYGVQNPSCYQVYQPNSYRVERPLTEQEERERIAALLKFAQAAGRKPSPAIAHQAKALGLLLSQPGLSLALEPDPTSIPLLPVSVRVEVLSHSGWLGIGMLLNSENTATAVCEQTQPHQRIQPELDQMDLSDLQAEIWCHCKRLNWDALQWQTYLEDNFGVSTLTELEDRQLRSLLCELECEGS